MLQSNERFQKDVSTYNEIINSMADSHEKLEAKKLLNDLIYEVKNIDNMFLDMVYSKQLPSLGNEFKQKIVVIRKKLDSIVKSHNHDKNTD